jgi:hypothetical protein|tara:strand:+ start:1497 stop:2000 length:504 start_codon:yes stop_codon:yes gene_type:complete
MANLGQSFNTNEIPESDNNFDPIPAGWYEVSVNSAELKETKAGTGEYIAMRYDVLGPAHQGRVIFGNLNIRNPNPKAQDIGIQQLGELMRAIGLASVEDTDQLVGGHLEVKVKIREASGGYEASNDVSGFKAIKGGATPMPAKKPAKKAAAAAEPEAAAGSPPWAKK